MKYLRMLITFLLGSFLFGLGFFVIKHINPSALSFVTIPKELFMLLIVSFIPFISSIESKVKMPNIDGIKYNSLLLECSFERELLISKEKIIAIIKDCYNGAMFEDRVLNLVYEDENEIVYHGEMRKKERCIETKNKRSINDFDLVITVEDRANGSYVRISSNSINPLSLSNNKNNEQHIKTIIERLKEEGILE